MSSAVYSTPTQPSLLYSGQLLSSSLLLLIVVYICTYVEKKIMQFYNTPDPDMAMDVAWIQNPNKQRKYFSGQIIATTNYHCGTHQRVGPQPPGSIDAYFLLSHLAIITMR